MNKKLWFLIGFTLFFSGYMVGLMGADYSHHLILAEANPDANNSANDQDPGMKLLNNFQKSTDNKAKAPNPPAPNNTSVQGTSTTVTQPAALQQTPAPHQAPVQQQVTAPQQVPVPQQSSAPQPAPITQQTPETQGNEPPKEPPDYTRGY